MPISRPFNYIHQNVENSDKPLIASLCGTFLKPEMQSIYRQIIGFKRVRTQVYTQSWENETMFPFKNVTVLNKLARPRLKGNFLLRFWFKHVVKQWPPPIAIHKEVKPHYSYDLLDHLQENSPDLIHVYYGHKAVHFLEMLEASSKPFVVSFHGVDASKFLDEPGYPEKLQRVFEKAELVMGRSHSLMKRLRGLGCPPEKLRLNRTPIPFEHLEAKCRIEPDDGEWRIVQACRLISKKGILTTLRALALIKDRFPKLRYVVCGDGPLKEEIQTLAKELGLEQMLELRGWLSQEQLLQEYEKAHAFIHASETTSESDQEGIPNSMLEAMALGLPVIATEHGGIPEAVTHEHEGLLAKEKDAEGIAYQLVSLFTNPILLARLSTAAAESVRKNFGADTQVSALEDVYFEAIQLSQAKSK